MENTAFYYVLFILHHQFSYAEDMPKHDLQEIQKMQSMEYKKYNKKYNKKYKTSNMRKHMGFQLFHTWANDSLYFLYFLFSILCGNSL